ncbi:class I SAM-dependent methyltransferase [Roseovarius salinarum]|uniref:class I SAM-dependent methyltransferase n=1 Tax=Roseovarius salinarum TaxID=1981892 RepID=UPI000C32A323|nr:class I SAM-dependent methyltransferase [Roseovarius salinarum]
MTARRDHWDAVYADRAEDDLSWFEAHPAESLELIDRHAPAATPAIDVGAGTARLIDALLARGFGPVTALDISAAALERAQARLGPERAARVDWVVADVTRWQPARRYGLWHDRAVFHFLTDAGERAAYVRAMAGALGPGGRAVIATFADDGPERCSGLPVCRYAPEALAAEIDRHAPGLFRRVESRRHTHLTPAGREQAFQTSVFARQAGAAA